MRGVADGQQILETCYITGKNLNFLSGIPEALVLETRITHFLFGGNISFGFPSGLTSMKDKSSN